MIEATSSPSVARAFRRAHFERSRAIGDLVKWLFGSR